jgi:tellurite resistance protein TehA-like permease
MWTEIMYGIGSFFQWSFQFLPMLGNNFNALLIVVGFAFAIFWISQLFKFSREAKENNTLE